jgi:hypothetical protein
MFYRNSKRAIFLKGVFKLLKNFQIRHSLFIIPVCCLSQPQPILGLIVPSFSSDLPTKKDFCAVILSVSLFVYIEGFSFSFLLIIRLAKDR